MINRYVTRQIVLATTCVTVIAMLLLLLIRSLRLIDFVINRGLPIEVLFIMTGLLVPTFIGIVLPISLFAGVLFVYNKMLSDSEIVVMRAVGVSSLKLARPAIIASLLIVGLGYGLSLYAMPASFTEFKEREFAYRNTYGSVLLQEGRFNNPTDGLTIYVRARSGSEELLGIFVHDARNSERPVTVMAERGQLVRGDEGGARVIMFNGNRQEVDIESGRLTLLYFDQNSVDLGLLNPNLERQWREPKERFVGELLNPGDSANERYYAKNLIAEGHRRLSGPLYAPAFVLIALASLLTGEINRRGHTIRVLGAVGMVAVLQGLGLTALNLASTSLGFVPVFYLLPLATVAIAGYVLASRPRKPGRRRAVRDRPMPQRA